MSTPSPYNFFRTFHQYGVCFPITDKRRITICPPRLLSLTEVLQQLEWAKPLCIVETGINKIGNPFVQVSYEEKPFMFGVIEFTNPAMLTNQDAFGPHMIGADFCFVNEVSGRMLIRMGNWELRIGQLPDTSQPHR